MRSRRAPGRPELRLDDVAVVVPSVRLGREGTAGAVPSVRVVVAELPLAGGQLADVASSFSGHGSPPTGAGPPGTRGDYDTRARGSATVTQRESAAIASRTPTIGPACRRRQAPRSRPGSLRSSALDRRLREPRARLEPRRRPPREACRLRCRTRSTVSAASRVARSRSATYAGLATRGRSPHRAGRASPR